MTTSFDVAAIRAQFPILATKVHGKPLVYLDNGATTQKPQVVLDTIQRYYTSQNANIHRGVHALSQIATHEHEQARRKIQAFIGARESHEIIFTRGTTEGINLVATAWGRANVREGDEIVISTMEHHSNIVPWKMLCEATGAILRVIPISESGEISLDDYRSLLSDRTRMVAIVHVSNALGTINPVPEMIRLAHEAGAKVLVDGAQAVAHLPLNVAELDADFYVFSGHKLFGPTGIGVLYGKADLLDEMPPYQGGGDMISSVTFEKITYNTLPYKFEGGTPDIAGAIGLGAAIDWVQDIGLENIARHEHALLAYATERAQKIPGFRIVGTASNKASILTFTVEGVHPNDIGMILDTRGIAVRTGHHCTQPLHDRFGLSATARASFAVYNTKEEIDIFVDGVRRAIEMLS